MLAVGQQREVRGADGARNDEEPEEQSPAKESLVPPQAHSSLMTLSAHRPFSLAKPSRGLGRRSAPDLLLRER